MAINYWIVSVFLAKYNSENANFLTSVRDLEGISVRFWSVSKLIFPNMRLARPHIAARGPCAVFLHFF